MRTRTLLLALTLLAGSLPLAPPASADFDKGADFERAYWGDTPSEASPGEYGRLLTVELRNADGIEFYDVRAELSEHANVTPAFPGAETTHLGKVYDSGDLWKAQFRVDLSPDLTAGQEVELTVKTHMKANEDGGTWNVGDIRRETIEFDVLVPGQTRISVDAPADTLTTDTRTTLPVSITNEGDGQAGTLEVSFAPSEGSGLEVRAPQTSVRVDQLAPGASHEIPVTLLGPSNTGVHNLAITVDYANTVGEPTTITRTLPFVVATRGQDPLEVHLRQEQVTAGRISELTFVVENPGQDPARDVELEVTSDGRVNGLPEVVPVNGTGSIRLGTVAPGETAHAIVRLATAEEAEDVQALQVRYRFTDASGFERSQTRLFGLTVEGAIDIQITGLTARLDPLADQLTVRGTITNTGNAPAANAYLRLPDARGIEGTEPRYQGDIDPDSPLPFTLTTLADENRTEDTVSVLLTWTSDQGQARQLEVSTVIDEAPGSAGSDRDPDPGSRDSPAPALLLVGLAIAGVALAVRARRER